jgi:hypothetical protein
MVSPQEYKYSYGNHGYKRDQQGKVGGRRAHIFPLRDGLKQNRYIGCSVLLFIEFMSVSFSGFVQWCTFSIAPLLLWLKNLSSASPSEDRSSSRAQI